MVEDDLIFYLEDQFNRLISWGFLNTVKLENADIIVFWNVYDLNILRSIFIMFYFLFVLNLKLWTL